MATEVPWFIYGHLVKIAARLDASFSPILGEVFRGNRGSAGATLAPPLQRGGSAGWPALPVNPSEESTGRL